MSESESLAESFLTMFPAINPLSAHAILSSGDVFGKFLELSNEGRNRALKTFQVPDESIALLNAISRYCEREDSKSGMTDCSSSVSSVPDSGNIQYKSARERKKPRYTDNIFDAAEPSNHTKLLNLPPDDQLNPTKWSVSCNSWLSGNADISDKSGQFNSSFNDKLFNCEKFDAKGFETVEFDGKGFETVEFDPKGFEISAATLERTWIPMIDVDCSPGRRSPAEAMNPSRTCMKAPYILQDNFKGEVIDVEDTRAFKKKNYAAKSSSFSTFLLDVEEDYEMGNVSKSEMSLGPNNNLAFTNSASDARISRGDTGQILQEEIRPHFATIERNNYPTNCQSGLLEEDVMGKDSPSSCNLAFKHTRQSNSADTPLSNALHSTQTHHGSPWTIEFLNRIREKSRLRQQSVPCNLSCPTFGFPNNTSKITKTKSPSVFELYKYEGSTPRKIFDKKPLKRISQPQNSLKNKKATASSVPQWTPVDKRARRALSFSSNDSSGQSKLIWMDNNPLASQRRL